MSEKDNPIRYCLTKTDIEYILLEILKDYWTIYPFNQRKVAQERFIKLAEKICINGGY